jgi:hypothetical protein
MEWNHRTLSQREKPKIMPMGTVVWYAEGCILVEFVACCVYALQNLRRALRDTSGEEEIIVQRYNARPHTARLCGAWI